MDQSIFTNTDVSALEKKLFTDKKHWTKAQRQDEAENESVLVDKLLGLLSCSLIQHDEDKVEKKALRDAVAVLASSVHYQAGVVTMLEAHLKCMRSRTKYAEQAAKYYREQRSWPHKLTDWIMRKHDDTELWW